MGSFPFTVSQRRLAAIALVVLVAIVLVAKHVGHGGASPPLAVAPLSGTTAADPSPARARSPGLVVDVAGAVRRPGVYTVPSGDRVVDAIARAGGFTAHADRTAVNLAAPLVDGEQVVVAGAKAAGAAGSSAAGAPVSLNSATAEQLDALPGIGPVTAQKIIDYRTQHGPFTSVDGLDAIPGIGAARIGELQGLVVP
ncbi:MAG TPA: ComEA family DNA-binding protein [Casimicrobiaceae bacterium]|nr:ComEA family DNA-binding protein [Casimicrobiaceae bacterium]